jgi:phage baseplate assembly protein V
MNAQAFTRATQGMRRRISAMVGRAVLTSIEDAGGIQLLQIDGLADETHDGVERLQDYGFTSVPFPGAEAAVMFAGGLRSHGLVVAVGDRRYRLKGLREGEVAVYDDQGQKLLLGRDGIAIETTKPLTITAETVLIEADAVNLGGAGGPKVARVGDTVAGGVITTGSAKVFAA